jgi:hypothetical protein
MTILGLPTSMFLVFMLTILAGCLGAIHYTIVHIILKRPFGDENEAIQKRDERGMLIPRTAPASAPKQEGTHD